jgi:hypothetical protein
MLLTKVSSVRVLLLYVLPAGNYRVEVAHRSVVAATNYHEEGGKLPLVIRCYILNPKSLVLDPNPSHYTLRRQVVVSRGNQHFPINAMALQPVLVVPLMTFQYYMAEC